MKQNRIEYTQKIRDTSDDDTKKNKNKIYTEKSEPNKQMNEN